MQTFILITIVVIATIHLMMASVLSLYSRYKVQYLSLAWIMGIQRQDGGHHQMNGGDNNNGDKNKCLHTRQS